MCHTKITFESDNKQSIDNLVKDIIETKTFLNVLRPMPAEYTEGEMWYDWRIEHWGTKWDLDPDELTLSHGPVGIIRVSDKKISITTKFAWAPPMDALLYYHQNNTDIKIESLYVEPGNDFCGHSIMERGDYTKQYHRNITDKTKQQWESDNSELGLFVCMGAWWLFQESEDDS